MTVLLYCWHSYYEQTTYGLYFISMNYTVHGEKKDTTRNDEKKLSMMRMKARVGHDCHAEVTQLVWPFFF